MNSREPSDPDDDSSHDELDVDRDLKNALDERGRKIDREEATGDGTIGWQNPSDEYGFASRGPTPSGVPGQPAPFQGEPRRASEEQRPFTRSRLFRALSRLLRRPT